MSKASFQNSRPVHIRRLLVGLLLMLLCGLFPLSENGVAQMESSNYRLANGSFTGGGGFSSGSGLAVVGSVPISGSRSASADNWVCYTGLTGTALGVGGEFVAYYTNQLLDTVEISDKLLKVSYGGGAGELSGQLFYRPGGAIGYAVTSLIKGEGDTLTAQLPSDHLGIRGLEFFFKLARGADTLFLAYSDSTYTWVTHFANSLGQVPRTTRASSYRMIGLPIEIEGSRQVASVFEDDLGQADLSKWRLGNFTTRGDSVMEFPECDPVIPGRGYWLITKDRELFGAAGYSVQPEFVHDGIPYLPIAVSEGWNQIANPFGFAVDFQDVIYERSGVIGLHDSTANVYWYAGAGYSAPKIMNAWSGYFFFTRETSLRLLFPYQEFGLPGGSKLNASPLTTDNLDWTIGLRLAVHNKLSEPCYAGSSSLAVAGLDQLDQPMPPAPPGLPVIGFSMKQDNPYLWRVDAHAPIDSIGKWELLFGPGLDRELLIDGLDQLPDGFTVLLLLDIGTQLLIESDRSIRLPDDSRSARLLIGRTDRVQTAASEALPGKFTLEQNFPNPFNPNTSLRFALPKASRVQLVIYNLLGQEVRGLVDRYVEAGVHTVVWNGRLGDGRPAASGIYFYRLMSDQLVASKKMLLLK